MSEPAAPIGMANAVWYMDAGVRGMTHMIASVQDAGGSGYCYLFLEAAIGAPLQPELGERAQRQMLECQAWLLEILRRNVVARGGHDVLTPPAPGSPPHPYDFAFAMTPQPGVVRVFRRDEHAPLGARRRQLLTDWAAVLGRVWPEWHPWLAQAGGGHDEVTVVGDDETAQVLRRPK